MTCVIIDWQIIACAYKVDHNRWIGRWHTVFMKKKKEKLFDLKTSGALTFATCNLYVISFLEGHKRALHRGRLTPIPGKMDFL